MTSNDSGWFITHRDSFGVISDHLESFKSWGDKISHTINMELSLSFFVGSQTQWSPYIFHQIKGGLPLEFINVEGRKGGSTSRENFSRLYINMKPSWNDENLQHNYEWNYFVEILCIGWTLKCPPDHPYRLFQYLVD